MTLLRKRQVRSNAGFGFSRLFVENHCPVCAAARLCTGFCREELALFHRVLGKREELALFHRVLGKDVKVERLSHILAGAGRCAYRVTPA